MTASAVKKQGGARLSKPKWKTINSTSFSNIQQLFKAENALLKQQNVKEQTKTVFFSARRSGQASRPARRHAKARPRKSYIYTAGTEKSEKKQENSIVNLLW
jgi:hypothetical protein